jgi:hypothetical protein
MLDKGITFIFGSWVCVAYSAGSFHRHLIDDTKLEASVASQRSGLDEFIDDPDEMLLPDLTSATLGFERKPNASHMCARIKFHIYDR